MFFSRRRVTSVTHFEPLVTAEARLVSLALFPVSLLVVVELISRSSLNIRRSLARKSPMGRMRLGGGGGGESQSETADPKGEKRKWPKRSGRRWRKRERRRKRENWRTRESDRDRATERSGAKGHGAAGRGGGGEVKRGAGLPKHPHPVAHPPLKKELILIRFFI